MMSTNRKLIVSAVLLGLFSAPAGLLSEVSAQTSAEMQTALAEARATIARLEAQLAEMQAQLAKQQAVTAELQAVCEALKKEAAVMRQQMQQSQAERDQRLQGFVEASDRLQQMAAENKLLKAENDRLRKLAGLVVEPAVPQTPDPESPKPPPLVDGRVLDVMADGEVTVSFGADNGLLVGHRLEIYRQVGDQGIYVGQVEVVRTTPKTSVCKPVVLKDTIRKGDQVASRL